MVSFFVPGIPRSKGSKSKVRGRLVEQSNMGGAHRASGALKAWMRAIGQSAALYRRCAFERGEPLRVMLRFRIPKPRTVKRAWPSARNGGDIDKLCRAVLDALEQAGLYKDDAQVVALLAEKQYASDDGPGVYVEVEGAGDG